MPTIEVSTETLEKIKAQFKEEFTPVQIDDLQDLVGKKIFFRTVTYHMIGKVKKVTNSFIQLENACWVADSGRFADALKTGKLSEVEPTGDHFVNYNSVVDFFPWKHEIPQVQIPE